MTEPQTFRDLASLARNRCRAAAESVTQLLDNEQEAAALLIAVATDMVYGASTLLGDDKPRLQAAVNMLIESLQRSSSAPPSSKEMRS